MAGAVSEISAGLSSSLLGIIGGSPDGRTALGRLGSVDILDQLQEFTSAIIEPLMNEVGLAAMDAIASIPPELSVGISFNVTDPRALAWASRRAGEFVVQISEDVRFQIRDLISRGYRDQMTVDAIARELRNIVGLHSRWATAVENMYARTLDGLVSSGVALGMATTQATSLAGVYRDKLIASRANTIARTEVIGANNAGRYLGWQQFMQQSGYPPNLMYKQWVVGPDGWQGINVCDLCLELDGTTVGVNDEFPSGRLMPPLHPNCRCTALLIFPEDGL